MSPFRPSHSVDRTEKDGCSASNSGEPRCDAPVPSNEYAYWGMKARSPKIIKAPGEHKPRLHMQHNFAHNHSSCSIRFANTKSALRMVGYWEVPERNLEEF